MKRLHILLWLLLSTALHAATIEGRVVGVADGDTLTVLDTRKVQYKVRLAGIDAPEKGQPFGTRSRHSLSALAFTRQVVVETSKTDRYGRVIGKVLVDGRDINLVQVERGMAWFYVEYQKEQSVEDRRKYAGAEAQASTQKVGLWIDQAPVPPWTWRREKRIGETRFSER